MYDFTKVNKKYVVGAIIVIILLSIGLTYFLCRGTHVSDIRGTVDRAEQYNKQTGEQIRNASSEVESALDELDGAGSRIDRVSESIIRSKESAERNKAEIKECERIIDSGKADISEARGIIESVRQGNTKSNA